MFQVSFPTGINDYKMIFATERTAMRINAVKIDIPLCDLHGVKYVDALIVQILYHVSY